MCGKFEAIRKWLKIKQGKIVWHVGMQTDSHRRNVRDRGAGTHGGLSQGSE
jgi:hypothetical protein